MMGRVRCEASREQRVNPSHLANLATAASTFADRIAIFYGKDELPVSDNL
jgi:hypothetical protein